MSSAQINQVPTASAFTPLAVPGCALWLDGADQTSMTLNQSTLTNWRDKSGNGYMALSFSNAVSPPTWASNVQNGRGVVQYAVGNGSFVSSFTISPTMTIFALYYPIGQTTNSPPIEQSVNSALNPGFLLQAAANNFTIRGSIPGPSNLVLSNVTMTWNAYTGAQTYTWALYESTVGTTGPWTQINTAATGSTSAAHTPMTIGNYYYFTVVVTTQTGVSPPNASTPAQLVSSALLAPTNLILTIPAGTSATATLAWTAAAGATTYSWILFTSATSAYVGTLLTSGSTAGTSATYGITIGSYNYFSVRAVTSALISAAAFSAIVGQQIVPPTGLAISASGTTVTMSWSAYTAATSYAWTLYSNSIYAYAGSSVTTGTVTGSPPATTATYSSAIAGTYYYFTLTVTTPGGTGYTSGPATSSILQVVLPTSIVATGGTSSTSPLGFTVYTFTTSDTWALTSPASFTAQTLVVGGGGGGGGNQGGAGGAGAALYNSNFAISSGSYSVTVGLGGATTFGGGGLNGGSSIFSSFTAVGGGGGGAWRSGAGSNGGCAGSGAADAGISGTPSVGFGGGACADRATGGGGGMGSAGSNAIGNQGGAGGLGLTYTLGGSSYLVCGGGGGQSSGGPTTGGAGGSGIGGTGGATGISPNTNATNPTPNTGSGGGGGNHPFGSPSSGATGIVVIAIPPQVVAPPTNPTLTTSGTAATMSWAAAAGATGYSWTLYQSATNAYAGTVTASGTTTTATTATASTVTPGLYGYFTVAATLSGSSSAAIASAVVYQLPAPPSSLAVTQSGTSIVISWGAVASATAYVWTLYSNTIYAYAGTQVATATLTGNPPTTSYTYSSPVSGTYYYFTVNVTTALGTSIVATSLPAQYVADGLSLTYTGTSSNSNLSGTSYTYLLSSGNLTVSSTAAANYLAIAGGGGGGNLYGGGGGAGGLLQGSTTITSGQTYVVTIGALGLGDPTGADGNGSNGGNTILYNSTTSTTIFTAIGGGGGGGFQAVGAAGGSGGGGGYQYNAGGNATSGQGFAGGAARGGGGGASGVGAAGASTGGNGGPGITYAGLQLGGGGGGGKEGVPSTGGTATFGGGNGGNGTSGTTGNVGCNATANTGGGGGGGSYASGNDNFGAGGNGGTGIVILSSPPPPLAPTNPTLTTSGTAATMSWTAAAGATGYSWNLYQSATNTYAGTVTATGTTTTATTASASTVTPGQYGYFTVAATSGGSSPAVASSVVYQLPAPPSSLVISPSGTSVAISWGAVSGATAYTYTLYSNTIYAYAGSSVATASTASTSYTYSSPVSGTYYYFTVSVTTSLGTSALAASSIIQYVTPVIFYTSAAATVTNLAGGGTLGFADGTGTNALFRYPSGVAYDPTTGNIVVADGGNNCIRLVTQAGVVTTLAGQTTAGFNDATGAAASFNYPQSVAVLPSSGNIVVGDRNNLRIRLVTPGGVVTTLAGNGGGGVVDGTGVAATVNALGIAVLSNGNIVFAHTNEGAVRHVTYPGGVVTTLAGGGGQAFADGTGTAARFHYPFGVAVTSNGAIVVGDTYNHRIRLVTSSNYQLNTGVTTTLAGQASAGTTDGTGTSASFNAPNGVAILPNGNFVVCDQDSSRIRMVTPAGVVTTLVSAGLNGQWGVDVLPNGNLVVGNTFGQNIKLITFASLATPTNLTLTTSGTTATMSWTAAASATGYSWNLYQSSTNAYAGTSSATGTTTSALTASVSSGLTFGNYYYFTVAATAGGSSPAVASSVVQYLPNPSNLTLSVTSSNATMSWSSTGTSPTFYYTLYQTTALTGSGTLTTIAGPTATGSSNATVTFTSVNSNYYYYTITQTTPAFTGVSAMYTSPVVQYSSSVTITPTIGNAILNTDYTTSTTSGTSYYYFRATGKTMTFTPSASASLTYFAIGGGGGGASGYGGGGGAGGLQQGTASLTASSYSIVIGTGGAGAQSTAETGPYYPGTNGVSTTFSGSGVSVTALGGGQGGPGYSPSFTPSSGGCGGGGGGTGPGIAGTGTQGYNGAAGFGGAQAGGGGGLGGAGSGSTGGIGITYNGSNYGGGGGGLGGGASYGGGGGGVPGAAGTANTGGGGGGSGWNGGASTFVAGAAGGSGIFILSYILPVNPPTTPSLAIASGIATMSWTAAAGATSNAWVLYQSANSNYRGTSFSTGATTGVGTSSTASGLATGSYWYFTVATSNSPTSISPAVTSSILFF